MARKGSFQALSILLATVGMLSCIPAQSTFYQPSGSVGKAVGNACRGHVGRPEIFKFQHDRVLVYAFLEEEDKQAKSLFVVFNFIKPYAPLMQILLPTDEFKIRLEGREEFLRLVRVYERREARPPNDSLLLESYGGMSYRLKLKPARPIAYEQVPEFTLLFPEMLIDGQPVTFAPIQWTLTKDRLRIEEIFIVNC